VNDRRVHARSDEMEIVRYERAGKWYLEPLNRGDEYRKIHRQRVSLRQAVIYALWAEREAPGGLICLGVPGGGSFDRLVERASE
jgi:hypothetical protein